MAMKINLSDQTTAKGTKALSMNTTTPTKKSFFTIEIARENLIGHSQRAYLLDSARAGLRSVLGNHYIFLDLISDSL